MKKIINYFSFLPSVFLITIFPILFFYTNNISELSLIFLKIPLAVSVLTFIGLLLILLLLTKNKDKSVLITCLFALVFFSYGHLSGYLNNKLFIQIPGGIVIGPDKVLLPAVFVLVLILIYKIFKTKKNLTQIITFINVVFILLCLNLLVKIFKIEFQKYKNLDNDAIIELKQEKHLAELPDVYHIILDGYARNDVLKDLYGYDNTAFTSELEKMGFFVAKKARSNYLQTYLSLPSTFNMIYLDFLDEKYGSNPVDGSVATNMMFNNQTFQSFKSLNYKTYNFVSDWSGTNENYPADVIINDKSTFKILGFNIPTSESNMVFLKTTLFSPLIQEVWESALRRNTLSVFEKMPDIPYLEGKKYVLAHIMSPHPPYVFSENGGLVNNPNLNNADEGIDRRSFYLDQLKFISNQTLSMLKRIISNSPKPPIIILQSDHGPGSTFGSRKDWKNNYSQEALYERSSILYAIFLPDKNYSQFYETITPVNTYKIIFNQYYGEKNDLLPNKSYYTSYDEIYGFYDITNP